MPRKQLAGDQDQYCQGDSDSGSGSAWCKVMLVLLLTGLGWAGSSQTALAQANGYFPKFGALEVVQAAIFIGAMSAALLSAVWLIRERGKISRDNVNLRSRITELNRLRQRDDMLLDLSEQMVLIWQDGAASPEIVGHISDGKGVPGGRSQFLAYGRWVLPEFSGKLETAISSLRKSHKSFDLTVKTYSGHMLDVHGRHKGNTTIVRFSSLSEIQSRFGTIKDELEKARSRNELFQALAQQVDQPVWLRNPGGELVWVNDVYAAAVDASDNSQAIDNQIELFGTQVRQKVAEGLGEGSGFSEQVSTVVAGDRRLFDLTEVSGEAGSVGVGYDVSDVEAMRADYERMLVSHADTLNQLTTAVAIFDENKKLRSYNQAFRDLWDLDDAYLESRPGHALILDQLRAGGKLAEQPEWRRWTETVLSAYQAVETQEHWWHLPGGRTVRVISNPHPKGGITWVFENHTETIDLQSRYNTLVKVQSETLDHLAEAVAVFGSDGRLRLSNPAFLYMWSLDEKVVHEGTHISVIRAACDSVVRDTPWPHLVGAVTGFDDSREGSDGIVEMIDGSVLRYAMVHLPNGQTMITFTDNTDTVNFERALKERNEALSRSEQLKTDFIHHISYELRSPLTNIIGFTELMQLPSMGALSDQQNEYVEHIASSSADLLNIVNDILDLATVDAGVMELEVSDISVEQIVEMACSQIEDRFAEHNIELAVAGARESGVIAADGKRVRQVLYNVLANAASYAPEGSVVKLECRREADFVAFSVHDDGPGIPEEILDIVFKHFERSPHRGRKNGAGLGLSIVKALVELHNGNVEIERGAKGGTTVTCRFPVRSEPVSVAA